MSSYIWFHFTLAFPYRAGRSVNNAWQGRASHFGTLSSEWVIIVCTQFGRRNGRPRRPGGARYACAQSIAMIRQVFTIHGGARTRTRARRFH